MASIDAILAAATNQIQAYYDSKIRALATALEQEKDQRFLAEAKVQSLADRASDLLSARNTVRGILDATTQPFPALKSDQEFHSRVAAQVALATTSMNGRLEKLKEQAKDQDRKRIEKIREIRSENEELTTRL